MVRTLIGSRMLALCVCGRISNQKPKRDIKKEPQKHQQHDFKINLKKTIEASAD